jgi:arylsulfatase A-like enzyme
MLGQLDDGVGAVLDAVKKQGIWENTLIVFFSDNGGPTRELTSSNLPLRGEKGRLFEGGIRVPFLLQYPGAVKGGQVYEKPVTALDLFPTSLALAGLPVEGQTDGVDLIPYLTGEKAGAPHESLFWRVGGKGALRKGDWKLVRDGNRKKPGPWMLFDLGNDIGETNDLAESEPEKLEELIETWNSYDQQMIEPAF